MISMFIFGIFCAVFALNDSLALTELKNELPSSCYLCNATASLQQIVDRLLQKGFTKHYNDYCRVAQYVSDELRVYPGGEWVVLIGAHGVMGKREEFAVKFETAANNFILMSYKGIHDVLVSKPLCKRPNQNVTGGSFIPRDFTDVITDMPINLEIIFTSEINKIFYNTNSDYQQTAYQTLNYAKKTCDGQWFVLVGPELVLNNKQHLCGVAKKYPSYNFNATYEYSHSVQLFSPICN